MLSVSGLLHGRGGHQTAFPDSVLCVDLPELQQFCSASSAALGRVATRAGRAAAAERAGVCASMGDVLNMSLDDIIKKNKEEAGSKEGAGRPQQRSRGGRAR
jgi:hypothetical protein